MERQRPGQEKAGKMRTLIVHRPVQAAESVELVAEFVFALLSAWIAPMLTGMMGRGMPRTRQNQERLDEVAKQQDEVRHQRR